MYLTQTRHFGKELTQMVMKSLPDWEEKFEAILDGDEDAENEYRGYFPYPLKCVCNINLDRFPVFKMSQKYDFQVTTSSNTTDGRSSEQGTATGGRTMRHKYWQFQFGYVPQPGKRVNHKMKNSFQ